MSIVAVAILISFHLKAEASPLEKRIALPFGLVFWCLAIACLAAGLNNYIKTVSRYSRRQALLQSGTGTQLVSYFFFLLFHFLARCGYADEMVIFFHQVFTVVATAIVAACVLFLSTNARNNESR